MDILKPIIFSSDILRVHPLQEKDEARFDQIYEDLYRIFSDKESLKFNPEKHISTLDQAKKIVAGAFFGYMTNSRYILFITHIESGSVIGEIMILPPFMAEEDHGVKDTWIIEFFLLKSVWNLGIMTSVLGAVIGGLKMQNIKKVGAFINVNNVSSKRVLEKNNFKYISFWDATHTYYELSI